MGRGKVEYAWNHEIALAYQVVGAGSVDLLYLQSNTSNVEVNWENPDLASFLTELAGLGRLVVVDRRGLGCSERFTPAGAPPIETLIDDVLAVIEAAACERPVLVATGDCGFFSCMLAATHPDRLAALILINAAPTWQRSDETPWARTEAEMEQSFRWCQDTWGSGAWSRRANPSVSSDRDLGWFGRYERLAQAPGALYAEARRFADTDVRAVLPAVQVPTLVLHRRDNPEERVEAGRYLGAHIPGASFVELAGADHFPWLGDAPAVIREIDRFLRTVRAEEADLDRVLATVLFTDIVASTEKAVELGDRHWRELVERHDTAVRAVLARYRGQEVNTTGDGFVATFDGPARAVRCAQVIADAVRQLGIEVRAGVHTGEIEMSGRAISGIAVNIGARIGARAGPSEVLVSQTVKDLVAGSGLAFQDRGLHELKGVPDQWRLFAVAT
jgi:class 3 adenylate cyclase/pimeloyl-ACP methyl ester carboxylesterase